MHCHRPRPLSGHPRHLSGWRVALGPGQVSVNVVFAVASEVVPFALIL